MNKVLSQAEVDALLKGMAGGKVTTESGAQAAATEAIPYDFTDQTSYLKRRPLNLGAAFERFARLFRLTLTGALRRSVFAQPKGMELAKFRDFIRNLPVPTSLHVFRIDPLPGLGILVLESPLIFCLLEAFFGSSSTGRTKVEGREFTPIENKVITKVVNFALADQEKAWESIQPLRFALEHSETNPQFAQVIAPDEVIYRIDFEVEFDEPIGLITFCIPYSTLEPIRDRLATPYHRKEQKPEPIWAERIRGHLPQCPVEVAVELGRTRISARDLLELKPGDVIVLDQEFSDPLVTRVEGIPKFTVFGGICRGNKAFRFHGHHREMT